LYPDLIVGTIHCHLDRHYETVDEYPSTQDIRSILKYCLMDVVVVVYICTSNYCVNRPLMMILEVDSSSSDVLRTAVGYNVLFTSDTVGWMILGLVLMRPVRLLEGFILAWVLDMWAERVRKKEVDAEAIAREKFHFYFWGGARTPRLWGLIPPSLITATGRSLPPGHTTAFSSPSSI
jgi:hypothetical protein